MAAVDSLPLHNRILLPEELTPGRVWIPELGMCEVELLPGETKSCRVTVPDHQLSLAIGNKGQNVRLCAHLTGYNIDIRPESGYYGEDEE